MTDLYLTRARPAASIERIGPVLFPDDPSQRSAVAHRLVWSMFPADLRERPFLYRETSPTGAGGRAARGAFFVLSTLPPTDAGGLFELETRPFAPVLEVGDRLEFSLRANATTQRSEMVDGRRRNLRFDVVMRALHPIAKGKERAEARPRLLREAGIGWLARQGEGAGFRLPDPATVAVDGYEQILVDPEGRRGGRRAVHGRLDFEGLLEVTDPGRFLARIATGFGRARAFGNGLMLIRRARGG